MKGVNDKRKYLVECKAQEVPQILRPLLKVTWVLYLWRMWCLHVVNRMTEGEVLRLYYEKVGQ